MKRTKAWWARLTKDERRWLVRAERAGEGGYDTSGYMPEGCGECPICEAPCLGSGMCGHCGDHYNRIIHKANGFPTPEEAADMQERNKAMAADERERRDAGTPY